MPLYLSFVPNPDRDRNFYKDDGKALHTKSPINHTLLSEKSPVLRRLLQIYEALPLPDWSRGHADESPILVLGPTAEEFRGLCWALNPSEFGLSEMSLNDLDLENLRVLLSVLERYECSSELKWVTEPIQSKSNIQFPDLLIRSGDASGTDVVPGEGASDYDQIDIDVVGSGRNPSDFFKSQGASVASSGNRLTASDYYW
ncbi:hypothetical protein B0H14DRAFT_2583614 [Mycena olivaceomarginata]|nr:hypothetical protein B0H14DRAFT_2583614 [Mycena olivaceomarginata]